jgi:hypothetical protein
MFVLKRRFFPLLFLTMANWGSISGKQAVKAFEKGGWHILRQVGSLFAPENLLLSM